MKKRQKLVGNNKKKRQKTAEKMKKSQKTVGKNEDKAENCRKK